MTLLAIDYESRFGGTFGGTDTLSIKSQGLEAYVRDWRFKAHGAAVSVDWGPDEWVSRKDLPAFLGQFDWPRTTCLSHNSQFDSLVTSHHYGHVAGAYLCTMQMARMLALPGSLAGLALHFGLPPKGKDLNLSKGLADLPPWVEDRIATYSKHDNWLCAEIFKRLRTMLPQAELTTISNVTKMFVRPLMRIDREPLIERIATIDAKHAQLLAEAGMTRDVAMSNLQLAAFMRAEGLEWTGSMAKTNPEFLELLEHPNDRIALAVAARLGIKGTMERSRCETFLRMGDRGAACVYINCGGAGTTRFSGGDGTNYQNLKRGSPVRSANIAPEGYELIVSDSRQIEARILDTLAGQSDAVARWRNGEDQYRILASKFYPDAEITKDLRNVGKVIKLASGYGMGAETLQRQLSVGLMGNPPLYIDMMTAEKWKNDYRSMHPMVVKLWYRANDWITAMAEGTDVDYMMLKIRPGRIELPNGLILRYPHLHQTPDGWTYKSQHGSYYKLWGGTLVQNVCEALARDVVIPQCNHVARELPWVSSTHDEGVFICKAEDAEEITPWVEDCFRTVLPDWAKGWPIDAEATHSPRYDK